MSRGQVRFAGGSDPGRVRHNNEDAWYADPARGVFLVVDGIGGQAAGEKAAEIAVARLRARLERQTGTAEQRIREAITVANNEILRAAQSRPDWEGMACVLTVALLEDGCAVVGHVGDSRLYQVRGAEIRKITHDHSPVGEREDNRELSEAEAMRHPRRNEVFRDVGSEERSPDDPEFIEIQRVPFEPDSALLLCSDGLSDQVPSKEIRSVVARHAGRPEEAVEELIAAANRAGGKDNVTVLVVEGETFGVTAEPRQVATGSALMGRAAMFAYGAVLAAVASFAVYWFTRPAPVVPPRLPAILTVGKDRRFSSIADAMAAARSGDTVQVGPGEYFEQVRLKDGVKLSSDSPYSAVLRAAPSSGGPAVVADNVKGARFSGFRIVADAQRPLTTGILVTGASIDVSEVEIQGVGVGIDIRGMSRVNLVANTIADCLAEGVSISGQPASQWISHNVIRRTKGALLTARDGAPGLDGNVFEKGTLDLPPAVLSTIRERNLLLDVKASPGAPPAVGLREKK